MLSAEVSNIVSGYPAPVRSVFLRLREFLLEEASFNCSIGKIEETLKWGEPAYLTPSSKSGSTVRIAWKPKNPKQIGIYFNCKTTLVDTCRSMFPELLYEGNRAILLDINQPLPEDIVRECFALALTYHRSNIKRRKMRTP